METKFIKVFENERDADAFAVVHNTKTIVHYDWDDVFNKIVRLFIVEY